MSPYCAYKFTITSLAHGYEDLPWAPVVKTLDSNLVLLGVCVSIVAYTAIFMFIFSSVRLCLIKRVLSENADRQPKRCA